MYPRFLGTPREGFKQNWGEAKKQIFDSLYNSKTIGLEDRHIIQCLKKTGPLQLISHNFTSSQLSLIIFGTERPYSIL